MNMNKKVYERPVMDVTEFDVEDVIAASGGTPGGGDDNPNPNKPDSLAAYELPFGL